MAPGSTTTTETTTRRRRIQQQQQQKQQRDDGKFNDKNNKNNNDLASLDVNLYTQVNVADSVEMTHLSRLEHVERNSVFTTCYSHTQLGNVPIFFVGDPIYSKHRIRREQRFDLPSATTDIQQAER
ncbi:hypothetical protein DPMN_173410 [Dreissena polymorpha]|uniref:Uncharacterized protein n=1 Tax=Dreissena polymorpha TaxID=45954 RepID=A0A9D4E472_DREPO|nr:hypothetical protein DPMN_173410 [Dreissena polymorpha]